MKILIISVDSKIPIINYGGTERVIWSLAKELSNSGNNVSFLVAPGSTCPFANVIHYNELKPIETQIPKDTEIIHAHSVHDSLPEHIPNIFTLHGNPDSNFIPPNNTVCISKNHAERCNLDTFVYNGIDWDGYNSEDLNKNRSYYHFLGKAKWKVKNFKDAVKIAVKSKQELHVLGGTKWNYRNLKTFPFLKLNPLIKYHGMVNNDLKMEIMLQSKGLIFPVQWHEPFGLAIIESMYAGCPVFGSKYGSLPELITEDVGTTSNDIETLIEAVKSNKYKSQVCHDYAREHFNSRVMANNYLTLYERALKGEQFNG